MDTKNTPRERDTMGVLWPEKWAYCRMLAGLAILLFPVTLPIVLMLAISKIRMWLWSRKHCLTPEQFDQQLASEGRITLI